MATGDPVGGKRGKTWQPATSGKKYNPWKARENMPTGDPVGKMSRVASAGKHAHI